MSGDEGLVVGLKVRTGVKDRQLSLLGQRQRQRKGQRQRQRQ